MSNLGTLARGTVNAVTTPTPSLHKLGARLAGAAAGNAVASSRLADSIDAFITPGSVTEQVPSRFFHKKTRIVGMRAPHQLLTGDVRTAMTASDARAAHTITAVSLLETIGSELSLVRSTTKNLHRAIDDAVDGVRALRMDPVTQQRLIRRLEAMRPTVDVDAVDPAWARQRHAPRLVADGVRLSKRAVYFVGRDEAPAAHVERLQAAVAANLAGRTPHVPIELPVPLRIHSGRYVKALPAGEPLSYRDLFSNVYMAKDGANQYMTTPATPALYKPLRDQLRAQAATLQGHVDGTDLQMIVREANDSIHAGRLAHETASTASASRAAATLEEITATTAGYESAFEKLALP